MRQFGTIIAPASVIDDSANVLKSDDGETVIGFTVSVLVLSGEFANATTVAVISAPLGSEVPNLPQNGTTLLVAFTEGVVDRGCYVIGQVPGGGRPIPLGSAGVAIDNDGLETTQVRQPPKGIGVREYIRGAPFVIRLKGKQKDFVGEFYVEFDDGAFLRGTWDPTSNGIGLSMKDAKGAFVSITGGAIQLIAPGKSSLLEVSDDGVTISSNKAVLIQGSTVKIDGSPTLINVPIAGVPPTPAVNGAAIGSTPGVASTTVFVGPLWQRFRSSSGRSPRRAATSR